MGDVIELLEFSLDGQKYAVELSSVERVVQSAQITPLPKAPESVLGVVDVQGQIFPVFNIRKRFGNHEKATELTDQFIIAHTQKRTVILLVDSVMGVMKHSMGEVSETQTVVPNMEYIKGIVKLEDGMVFIHDLDSFLSLEEEHTLNNALREKNPEGPG